jgi:hypothetical protein
MAHIPIHNETDYAFTEAMTQQIIRDAQEHVGEEVRAIRVQAGLERPCGPQKLAIMSAHCHL